ncbi:MAG: sugar/nucleoside kinase (ribokinase family) [Flavobacteriales bacterium]|jgi:sugar/nucleoside kinase (ribokinase family)
MTHIAIIGECMVELIGSPFGEMRQSFGGDTLNSAIYLNRCLSQNENVSSSRNSKRYFSSNTVRTSYVTALGTDIISDGMIARWQEEGLSTDLVLRDDSRTPGIYLIQVDENGERSFIYWRNDSAARYIMQHSGFTDIKHALSSADMIFLSGVSLAILPYDDQKKMLALLKELRQKGCEIVFDSNYRPSLWAQEGVVTEVYQEVYQTTDIALVTFDDEQLIWGDATPHDTVSRLHRLGVKTIVVKLGAEGCLVCDGMGSASERILVEPVEKVIDSTSAGDSFNGGFLACYLTGGTVRESCSQGNALARLVIQHQGAIIPESITATLKTKTKTKPKPKPKN